MTVSYASARTQTETALWRVGWEREDGDWSSWSMLQSLGSLLAQTPASTWRRLSRCLGVCWGRLLFLDLGVLTPVLPTNTPGTRGVLGLLTGEGGWQLERFDGSPAAWEFTS
jgi:hypothetical protein